MRHSTTSLTTLIAAAAASACLALPAAAQDDSARFEVEGDTAYLEGELGERIRDKVANLLQENPDLQWISTVYVPGSDTDSNLEAARLVRGAGIGTYIPADGMIASGGTDFFLSGVQRVVEQGACIGVHSWADDGDRRRAADIPREDEAHKVYLDYYRDIGIDEAFYWFTLRAAPAEGMHWMTEAEIRQYRIATEIVPTDPAELASFAPCEER
jgi:hypothetical protein